MAHWKAPVSPLGQFFGGYLHQDFKDEFPDAWSAVVAYVADEPREERAVAHAQLVDLLQNCESEQALSDAVDRFGLAYHPPGAGMTYRAFLEKVEQYLREHEG